MTHGTVSNTSVFFLIINKPTPAMTDPPIALRPAQPDDEDFLFDLYAGTRRAEMEAWGLDDAMLAQMLRMQFAGQQGTYRAQFPQADHRIILHDGVPVGRILIDREGPEIVLVDVALVPALRGRGIGTWLLKDLLAEAAEADRPVRLKVVLTNPARRLYERLGFVGLGNDGVYEQMEWRSDFESS